MGLCFLGGLIQQYEELFGSRKGEMITAAQERMDGLFSGVGGFSQFEAVSQVRYKF